MTNYNQAKTVIKETKSKGLGLFSTNNIPANEFIIEYLGEMYDSTELYCRQQKFGEEYSNYVFKTGDNEYIDARYYGNEARFINHSCQPNSYAEIHPHSDQSYDTVEL